MAVPKTRDRIKHFRKVERFKQMFHKEKDEKKPESDEEKKAKEDKILSLFGMKKEKSE